ncbi:MAG: hypothetical protein JRE28_09880 [Deltaproteobacteria bacterium]|nr:hypothetical protein [Deltaproteobacteria bacterium]
MAETEEKSKEERVKGRVHRLRFTVHDLRFTVHSSLLTVHCSLSPIAMRAGLEVLGPHLARPDIEAKGTI